jgi:peptide deformylase
MPLNIVAVEQIPTKDQIQDVPLNDLSKVYRICLQLQELCNREQGIGISAVQAGIPWKLCLIKLTDGIHFFLNCEYSPDSEDQGLWVEGCLSLKRKNKLRTFEVRRYKQIKVNGYELLLNGSDLELKPVKDYIVTGFEATIFQHEIDHHRSVLISEIGKEIELTKTTL